MSDSQDGEPIVLPYWVSDHIHGKTIRLILAWIEWKSKNGYKPGTLCPRGAPSGDWWEVEEMGHAFLDLQECEQIVLAVYLLEGRGREKWRNFRCSTSGRISMRDIKKLLMNLQNNARRRGLLRAEDVELAMSARETGPPPKRHS